MPGQVPEDTLRVLIVEDNEDDFVLLTRALKKQWPALQALRVESREALESALEGQDWDAVLSDFNLPSFSGLDALDLVRGRGRDLPFILVSGFIGEEAAVELMRAGAHDYIVKGKIARLVPAVEREVRECRLRRKHHEAEEELRLWGHVFKNAQWGIALVEATTGLLGSLNPHLASLYGRSVEELRGRPFGSLFIEGQYAALEGALGRHRQITMEARHLRADGSEFPVQVDVSTIYREDGQPAYHAVNIQDISARRASEEKIRTSLREKEVLLREVHHRVKNNMAVITSLLRLQGRYSADPAVAEALARSHSRIRSMAMLHDRLYEAEDVSRISLLEYIEDLAGDLCFSCKAPERKVRVNAPETYPIDLDTLIPLGLILNELITNSLKHTVGGGGGSEEILVKVRMEGERTVLEVSDHGPGLPGGLDIKEPKTLGLMLVTSLAGQIEGAVEAEGPGGKKEGLATVRVSFPTPSHQAARGGEFIKDGTDV